MEIKGEVTRRDEHRKFSCWRFNKALADIHYVYEKAPGEKERLVFASCSLMSSRKCDGMQSPDRPCPLILRPDSTPD